jgi:molecular chaperone DnaJ
MLHCSTAPESHVELDDPYRELGLTPEASDAEVKAAWRRLSARWHPDRNASPQALHRIQRINRALEDIRAARGLAPAEPAAPAPSSPAPVDPGHEAPDDDAIELGISLSLEEAAAGCIRSVQGSLERLCACCSGSDTAAQPAPCTPCGGLGQLRQTLWFPWLSSTVACEACKGTGSCPAPCTACDGSGQAEPITYRSRIRIPPGVRDGHVLHARVKLQGRAGHQSLDVRITLRPHEFMVLQDDGCVQLELPVDGFAWMAGRWIDVPTPYGIRQMRLQRGALTYRIRDAGLPSRAAGPRADCLVTVAPQFPSQWSPAQEALIDQLMHSNTGDVGTDAGLRAQAWQRTVAAWQGRQADATAD